MKAHREEHEQGMQITLTFLSFHPFFCKKLFKTCSNFFLVLLKGTLPNVVFPFLFVRCFKTTSFFKIYFFLFYM